MIPTFPKKVRLKSGETLLIREAEKRDARALIDYLNTVAGETYFLTFGGGEFFLTAKEEADFVEKQEKSENCLLLVAELGSEIIAVSNISGGSKPRQRHVGEFGITVRRAHWGKGVGSALMSHLIEWAKATGIIRKINLKVQTDNEAAIALYKKFGFVEEGCLKRDSLIKDRFYDSYLMGLLITSSSGGRTSGRIPLFMSTLRTV